MFLIDRAARAYKDPWAESVAERLLRLRSRPVRVAYLHERPNSSTFRYRAYNMQRHINDGGGAVSASYFFDDELDLLAQELDQLAALIVSRYRYDHRLADLVALARRRSVKVLYDVDDYVFDPGAVQLVINTLALNADDPSIWDAWFAYAARVEAGLKLADGAITTTRYLADRIAAHVPVPVSVVPNFLNPQQLEASDLLFREKIASGYARDGYFDIGYFSGTPTHQADFELAKSALRTLLAEDPNTRLLTVGYLDASDLRREFPDRIKHAVIVDFVELQRLIASVEVNIVPLQDNAFTNAKSELKFFEAAAVGTVTVASATAPYVNCIDNGRNGFIARNGEWRDRIGHIRAHMSAYPGWAGAARTDALAGYSGKAITTAIEDMLHRFGIGREAR